MIHLSKKCGWLFLAGLVSVNLVSCSDSDPNNQDIVPPTVAVAPNTVSGVVAAKSGEIISGATVTLDSLTTTTDANGLFRFAAVPAGKHRIAANAPGKVTVEETIVVEAKKNMAHNLMWNALLPNEVSSQKNVNIEASKTEEVVLEAFDTETLKGNEVASVEVSAVIPAASLEFDAEMNPEMKPEEVEISLEPLYQEDGVVSLAVPRAQSVAPTLLTGALLTCNRADVELKNPIAICFDVDDEVLATVMPMMLQDGAWVAVDYRKENGKMVVLAPDFTAYGLFASVKKNTVKDYQTLTFSRYMWDNVYGIKEMKVKDVAYSYLVGAEITASDKSQLSGLLKEALASQYGTVTQEMKTVYPLQVTLPVGTKLEIRGKQTVESVMATVDNSKASATASSYSEVQVEVKTSSRTHNGGTN